MLDHHLHRQFLIEGDANGYWELARHLAAGEDFAIHTPPRYALRMPGFPAVLAGSILMFGESLFAARLVLALIGTLGVYLVYVLGRDIADARTGLWAAGWTAVSPALVGFTPVVLGETCFAVAMTGCLIAGNRLKKLIDSGASRTRIASTALLTGVLIAVAVAMRPSWILAGPIFAGLLVSAAQRKRIASIAAVIVVSALVLTLLPWGIRNRQVTGHFTLTTFWMGPSLYDGLNPRATGDSDMRFFDEEQLSLTMSEYEVDREYRRRAWEFVRNYPSKTAQLALAKLVRYWKPWPNAAQFDRPILKVLVSAGFIPLMVLAVWGGWQLRAQLWSVAILAGPICYFALIHMVFVSSLRYRLPAEYPLAVLSAYGLTRGFLRNGIPPSENRTAAE